MRRILLALTLLFLMAAPLAAQVPKTILAEDATATWCGYCPYAYQGLDMMHSWFDANEFLSVRYYSSSSGGGLSTPEGDAAISYYGVTGFPTVVFEGVTAVVGGSTGIASGVPYKTVFESLKGPSPFKLEVNNFDPNAGSVDIYLEVVADPGVTSQMKVKMILYENNVTYSTEVFSHVTRDILTPQNVTVSTVGQSQSFSRAFTADPSWKKGDLVLVAIVQNDANKEILQAASSIKPQYSITYYCGDRAVFAPVGTPVSLDDITIFNQGTGADTATVRIVKENVPAGWTEELSDGTNSYPTEMQAPLAAGANKACHLAVTPTTPGYAVYRVEMFSNNLPAAVKSVRYTVITNQVPILLVDDDGTGSDNDTFYTEALDTGGYNYAVWPLGDAPVPAGALSSFSAVIWQTSANYPTLDPNERDTMAAYLDGGGHLFVSGQYIAFDLNDGNSGQSTPEAKTWFQDYLHALYAPADNVDDTIMESPGDVIGDGLNFAINGGTGADNTDVDYMKAVGIRSGAYTSFYFPGYATAGLRAQNPAKTNKLVYFAFNFDAIDTAPNRAEVMKRVLDWFGVQPGNCSQPPDRIGSLSLSKSGSDLRLAWPDDPKAIGGYNVYSTETEEQIPNLRIDRGQTPVMNVTSPTATITGGLAGALTYYQVLGSCGGSIEGPN